MGSPVELASATFAGVGYSYVGHYAYQILNNPLNLGPGKYYLGGIGWSLSDPEHNGFYSGNDESFIASALVTFLSAPYDPDIGSKFVPASDETGRNYFDPQIWNLPRPRRYQLRSALRHRSRRLGSTRLAQKSRTHDLIEFFCRNFLRLRTR